MPYSLRDIKDIPKWLNCSFCGSYNTKQRSSLIKHFNICEEYDGHIDDVESEDLDDNNTVGDYINQEMNCITITKSLIQTNELHIISNNTRDEILLFIKNKLTANISSYEGIDLDSIKIYIFFFGEEEGSDILRQDEFYRLFLIRNGINQQ